MYDKQHHSLAIHKDYDLRLKVQAVDMMLKSSRVQFSVEKAYIEAGIQIQICLALSNPSLHLLQE